ncbi:tetratricopeptide repeat protein [Nonomuraea dietziae]|uniref:tetratricopeptide repeat protein n=1 Tax=Nonomuraea dietziae TaxID=65515 RepID=UPI0033D82514
MTDSPRPAAPSAVGGDASGPQAASLVQVNAPGPGGVVNAVQGGVLNVYQWKPAYQIEEFPAEPRPVQPARARAQPSLLLRAGSRVVPFTGRQDELRRLIGWRDDEDMPGLGVRLLHGPGGQGKTRLATHFAELSREAGWRVWQATTNLPVGATAEADERGPGLLVVVDYAERWPVPALYELLQEPVLHAGRVRVLLLARPAGVWWDSIAAWIERVLDVDADAQPLPPLVAEPAMRKQLFAEARDHFARHLHLPSEQAVPIAPPAGLTEDDEYAQVLTVHIAALAAVDAHHHGEEEPADPTRATAYLLRREREHWAELHRRLPEPLASDPITMGRAVFTAAFTRPLARPDAWQALRQAGLADSTEQANILLDDHKYCYPPARAGTVLEPLYPDRLAEDFAALTIPGHPLTDIPSDDWAGHAVPGLLVAPLGQVGDAQVLPWTRAALTMLIEIAHRWPHVATAQLIPLLTIHPELILHAGGAALTRLATLPHIEPALLQAIEAHLPTGRHVDLDIGMAALSSRLTTQRLAAITDPAQRAAILIDHANRLGNAGQHQAAMETNEQAVALYSQLAELNRDAYLPHLATALNNHANLLVEVGQRAEAMNVSQQAVEFRRELVKLNSAAYLPQLAVSLNNHATFLAEVGRRAEAVEVSRQAVKLYEELVELNRSTYLPNLAASLNNHANRLVEVGRRAEAVKVSQQAVKLYEELVELNHAAYSPDLAMSLTNHANRLVEVGRRAEAVEVSRLAVQMYGELAELNRDAFLPYLAGALANHANRLVVWGRRAEAVEVSQQAVKLYEELVELNGDVYSHRLSMSLSNYAVFLAEVGRRSEAVPISGQAVELRRELVELNRDAYLPDFANSLNNHAKLLAGVGRRSEAVPISGQAVELCRELVELNRDAHLPDLASSLTNHAIRLVEVGRSAEALEISWQAKELCEELVRLNRAAYLPRLAKSLNNHANLLAETGQHAEAFEVSQQATKLCEELVELNRDAYLPDLATSLTSYTKQSARVGRLAEALEASQQAKELCEELVELNRDAYLPDLASSLTNLATLLVEVERHAEALAVSQQGVKLNRHLMELNRAVYLLGYVRSCTVQGLTLWRVGRPGDAVTPLVEALAIGQELPAYEPDAVGAAVGLLRDIYRASPQEVGDAFESLTGLALPAWLKQ